MAILRIQKGDGPTRDVELIRAAGGELSLGSAADNGISLGDITLPANIGIVKRSNNGFYTLILEPGVEALRNDHPIFHLAVLRNEDVTRIGDVRITYLEIAVERLTADSMWVGTECLFCQLELQPGDQVIFCPKCETPYHYVTCWSQDLYGETCSRTGCGYTVDRARPYAIEE